MNGNSFIAEYDITGVQSQINFGDGSAGDGDGFYNVANLSQQFGTSDFFPNEIDFGIGTLTYDDTGLIGVGTEIATITAFNPDLFWAQGSTTTDLNDAQGFDLWVFGANSSVDFGGLDAGDTVTLTNGVLTSIDLATTASISLDHAGRAPGVHSGTFEIIGNQLSFQIDDTAIDVNTLFGTAPTSRLVADFTGTVNAVSAIPEPSSFALIGLAGAGIAWRRRRSRRIGKAAVSSV
ncbi:MAG: PEP-CTERM sorting domain-containing protein [Planctomycetota bacterium]